MTENMVLNKFSNINGLVNIPNQFIIRYYDFADRRFYKKFIVFRKERVIFFNEEITHSSADKLISQLKNLELNGMDNREDYCLGAACMYHKSILLCIGCPGGDFDAAAKVHQCILNLKINTWTAAVGTVNSPGSLILIAAKAHQRLAFWDSTLFIQSASIDSDAESIKSTHVNGSYYRYLDYLDRLSSKEEPEGSEVPILPDYLQGILQPEFLNDSVPYDESEFFESLVKGFLDEESLKFDHNLIYELLKRKFNISSFEELMRFPKKIDLFFSVDYMIDREYQKDSKSTFF